MLHKLFTVFDSKAEIFLPPFFVPTLGIAKRAFIDCINSPDHQFGKHPSDYTLFQLGNFNDADGMMEEPYTKKSIGNGVEFLDPEHEHSIGEFTNGQTNTPIQPDKDS